VLLLQILLGLRPDIRNQQLRSVLPLELPSWVGSLRLSGLRAFDRTWEVRVEEGMIRVDADE
jgi:hypothetical protein